MLEIHEIPVTPFQQNCTLLVCSDSGAAAVCDCGDAEPVLARIADLGVDVKQIIATHGHLDHVGGTYALQQALKVPFWFPQGDAWLLAELAQQARMYGFAPITPPVPDGDLPIGVAVKIGNSSLEVRHCPGHTPGHIIFFDPADLQVVVGDVLFQGSIGRTDFPRGSLTDLTRSIQQQLYTLPAQTVVHCGHGPTTTIGHEAKHNPFVRAV
jgi:hydroxyacylglutathione hydrolase